MLSFTLDLINLFEPLLVLQNRTNLNSTQTYHPVIYYRSVSAPTSTVYIGIKGNRVRDYRNELCRNKLNAISKYNELLINNTLAVNTEIKLVI